MLKKIKAFLNKENFDCSKGHIDPYKYHYTCYYILKFFQVLDNEPIPKWTYIFVNFMAVCAVIALFLLSLSTYHGVRIKDLSTITEAGCYFIILSYEMLMLLCTKLNLKQYKILLETLREDFHNICTTASKYKERFFNNQLKTWKLSIFSVFFTSCIGVGVVTFTSFCLAWHNATHEPNDGTNRPLLFPFWFYEINFYETPLYEISFVFSNFCSLAYAYSYIFMLQTQILWVNQITTKADIIIWYIQDLMNGLSAPNNRAENEAFISIIKSRLKFIIQHHHSMYRLLESYIQVYKKLLMFEQKASAPVVCLTAYCTAEKLKVGEVNGILMLLCIGTIIEVFIPCYLCTFLAIKVESVGRACLDVPFWIMGQDVRSYFVLIMQSSQRPLQLSLPGFEEVSVQTFSNKMAAAYSFFNMLRQANI